MVLSLLPLLSLVAALLGSVQGARYNVQDTFIGRTFLDGFEHDAIPDPTHGRVEYVNQATATSRNLTFASADSFVIRADYKTRLTSNGPGRGSVRLKSHKSYRTHVAVFDIRHMPQGCGTWPAVWEFGEPWPNAGEVDIVEGVNDQEPNSMVVHTSSGCTMPATGRNMTGTVKSTNCDSFANGNEGCGVSGARTGSYGKSFNQNGGGWYAIERTQSFIKIFFWPRNSTPPEDVLNGGSAVNTDGWGIPAALFPKTSTCDINAKFGENNIIINLTLCGDWAGQASLFNAAGCPGDCVAYVNNNPSAFVDAYWEFASIRVYT